MSNLQRSLSLSQSLRFEFIIQNQVIMKNIIVFTHHFVLKGLGVIFLFFLFTGLTCEEDDSLYCETPSTNESTWPGDIYGLTWESNINSSTNYYRLAPGRHYNICPKEPVTLSAKVVGKDNTFIPPPNYIRMYWETDLGWIKWKNYVPLTRQSEFDNVWEATVPLGKLSYNFDDDQAANLNLWLLMEFPSIDNTQAGDYTWLTHEFTSMQVKADLVLYSDRDP